MGSIIRNNSTACLVPYYIENLLANSNDLSVSGTTNGKWSARAGLDSPVTKTATDPFGVPNNASVITGGSTATLVLRQNIRTPANISSTEVLTVSGWFKRVSGTRKIGLDIGDGEDPSGEPFSPPTENEWYWHHWTLGAGSSDWLDIFFTTSSGQSEWHVYGLNLNHGSVPLIYTETGTDIQLRDQVTKAVKITDLYRISNEVV